jgi:hypothetical protein
VRFTTRAREALRDALVAAARADDAVVAAATGTGALWATHDAAVRAIRAEAARHDPALAGRLAGVFEDLRSTP